MIQGRILSSQTGKWIILAALAAVLAVLLATSGVRAQDNSMTIEYAENGKDPVTTFTATDPEGETPVEWFILTAAPSPLPEGFVAGDFADQEDFDIDKKTGALVFDVGGDADTPDRSVSPDYENPGDTGTDNTYNVVVAACDLALASDGTCSGVTGYHKVTVRVTDMDEQGTVTLDDADATDPDPLQYLVGITLTATAKDGDITNATQTFTADVAGEVTGVTWRWYRGGTEIPNESGNTYTLQAADAGQHVKAVVYYVVAGNTAQETAEGTIAYTVLAARSGNNMLKFDPASVERSISEGDKGRNVGAPVTVKAGSNHGAVAYTLTGTIPQVGGANAFEIDRKTGQIKTLVDLDYDGTPSCTDNTCTVMVRATDASGSATAETAAENVFLDATVTIKVTNVDEKPVFVTDGTGPPAASSPKRITVPENSADLHGAEAAGYSAADAPAVTYGATDPEGITVTYSLTGPDASKFQTKGTPPVLSFKAKPDYEAKADANRDNVYEVTVRATAGSNFAERMVKVTVMNVDEGPDVSGLSSKDFRENGKDPVTTFTATDPEGETPVEWFILTAAPSPLPEGFVAGDFADQEDFDIDKKTGALVFDVGGDADTPDRSVSPDYENPGDTGTDNTYNVVVAACDLALASDGTCSGVTGYHKVTVRVTDMDEQGTVTLDDADATDPDPLQYLVGITLTATAKDGDITNATQTFTADVAGEVTGVTWRWYRGGTEIPNESGNTYTLQAADAGQHVKAVVYYVVAGNTAQETAEGTIAYTVLAARSGNNMLKFDPASVERSISEGDKGRNVGAPVTVKAGSNHGAVAYTLTGTIPQVGGANAFEIDRKTGQIKTLVDLDYDGTPSCTDNTCTVMVRATDASGSATAETAAENVFLDATVTIKVTNVDEKPVFVTDGTGPPAASSPKRITVPENSADLHGAEAAGYSAADAPAVTYGATDPEGITVTYSLTGPDASKFQTKGTPPVLSFKAKPDYEAKADANRDNVYEVTVRASDGTMHEDRMVKVTVTPVDEAPEIIQGGLAISGASSRAFAEGGMDAVATYTVAGPMKDMAMWTLEGDDAMHFSVGTARGAMTDLMFRSAPNYEMPRGMAMSETNTNTYMVTLKANDGEYMDTHAVTVTVTNVDEDGTVTLAPATQPQVGTQITATLNDPDSGVTGDTWQWSKSMTMDGTFMDISGATSMMYTPADADAGYYLKVEVMYTDVHGEQMAEVTTTMAVTANRAPAFADAAATREVAENTAAGMNIGDPVSATDLDGDTLTYALGGDDMAHFDINTATGQLMTKTVLDYEMPRGQAMSETNTNAYMVTITATDPDGESDSIGVTINVTDVDESPMARYDADNDGMIVISELFSAIDDYFDDKISISELFEVIDAYFATNG